MNPSAPTYFALRPRLTQAAPVALFAQDQRGELYLGPHVRLRGFMAGWPELAGELGRRPPKDAGLF